jgi:putative transposase
MLTTELSRLEPHGLPAHIETFKLPNTEQPQRYSGTEVWLSVKDVCELTALTKVQVHRNRLSGKYSAKEVVENGGKQYRILLASLPEPAQIKYALAAKASIQNTDTTLAVGKSRAASKPDELSEREMRLCLVKADMLKLYAEAIQCERGELMQRKAQFVVMFNSGAWQTLLDEYGQVSYQTLDRWLKTYRDAGNDAFALLPNYKTAKGKMSIERTTLTEEQQQILIRYALNANKLPMSEVIKHASKEFEMKELPRVCEKTCRRFLTNWRGEKMRIWTLCREGEKALNDKILPYISRNPDAIEVGDVLVIDGWKSDFDIIHPATGKKVRMMVVTVFDMRSAMPLGWEIMPSENTMAIAAAMRRAMMRLQFVPRTFYMDNGLAARGKFFRGVQDWSQSATLGLFDRLKPKGFLGAVYAWAYHGQSKTIEPFHRHYASFSRTLPTHRGNRIENKPAHLLRGEFFHREMFERIVCGYAPTIQEAHAMLAQFLDAYANERHGGKYLNGKTPREVYLASRERVASQSDFHSRRVTPDELDYLMMAEHHCSITKSFVRFRGNTYYHDTLADLPKGNKGYTLRYDIENDDCVRVYDEDGSFICQAVKWTDEHPMARLLGTEADEESLRAKINIQRSLKKETLIGARELIESESEKIAANVEKIRRSRKNVEQKQPEIDEYNPMGMTLPDGKVIKLF